MLLNRKTKANRLTEVAVITLAMAIIILFTSCARPLSDSGEAKTAESEAEETQRLDETQRNADAATAIDKVEAPPNDEANQNAGSAANSRAENGLPPGEADSDNSPIVTEEVVAAEDFGDPGIIIRSENALSSAEKEDLLKDLEYELNVLFSAIEDISEEVEPEFSEPGTAGN